MEFSSTEMTLKTGKEIVKYTLENDQGMKVEVLNLGATLTKVMVPDQNGNFENVVLEWQDVNVYEQNPGYIGAVVGRVAGRISQAKITLDEKVYPLTKNENSNILHGGIEGFHSKLWQGEDISTQEEARLKLSYYSKDKEEGFPGNMQVTVIYSLNNDNELTIRYEATTDKLTVVNLTNHAYFNLSGDGKRSILDQEVFIDSDKILELDKESIPTGKNLLVDEEKAFDFRQSKPLGRDISADSLQLKYGKGYDHLWVLNQSDQAAIALYDPISKRCMEITTDQPCVVMYTMNNPPSERLNIANQEIRYGVCFETQKRAIGYNEVFKEDTLLRPNEVYTAQTKYRFTTR